MIHLVLLVLFRNALAIRGSSVVCMNFEIVFLFPWGQKAKTKKKSTVYDYSALNVVDIIWGESVIFSMIELNL